MARKTSANASSENPTEALHRLLLNARTDPVEKVLELIAKGARGRTRGLFVESTALMLAVASGFEESSKALLPISNPRALDMDGNSPMISAVVNGELGCARLLARWDPRLARAPDEFGNAPVKIAAMIGHADMVGMLMEYELGARGGMGRLAGAVEGARENQHDDLADWIETAILASREKSVLARTAGRSAESESRRSARSL